MFSHMTRGLDTNIACVGRKNEKKKQRKRSWWVGFTILYYNIGILKSKTMTSEYMELWQSSRQLRQRFIVLTAYKL